VEDSQSDDKRYALGKVNHKLYFSLDEVLANRRLTRFARPRESDESVMQLYCRGQMEGKMFRKANVNIERIFTWNTQTHAALVVL
jgi:hypothetical protein